MASTANMASTAMVNTVTASADIFLLLPPVDLSAIIFRNCVRGRMQSMFCISVWPAYAILIASTAGLALVFGELHSVMRNAQYIRRTNQWDTKSLP